MPILYVSVAVVGCIRGSQDMRYCENEWFWNHFSLCCIAPVLAAKVLPGCEITVGGESSDGGRWPYAGTVEGVKTLGATHVVKDVCVSFILILFNSSIRVFAW